VCSSDLLTDSGKPVGVAIDSAVQQVQQMLQNQAQAKLGDSNRWQELTTAFPFSRLAEPNELGDVTMLVLDFVGLSLWQYSCLKLARSD
jgi:hypothetical protein